MPFTKLPPIEAKNIKTGCMCCSTACQVAHMDMIIAVGFGSAHVTKDGECVYDEQAAEHDGKPLWTVQAALDGAGRGKRGAERPGPRLADHEDGADAR